MVERATAPRQTAPLRPLVRFGSAGLACWLALVAHGPAWAGLSTEPVAEPLVAAVARAALLSAERAELLTQLIERQQRLERQLAATLATRRGSERRLRQLAADYVSLGRTATALDETLDEQRATVHRKQQRLEALLAEIVQISRQESGDARRLAQLRAVAGSLARPFATARAALDDSRSARGALDARLAAIAQVSVEARQALVDAEARAARLALAVDTNRRAVTEAAGRQAVAAVAAGLARNRLERVLASRAIATADLPSATTGSVVGTPRRTLLEPPVLTAQASLVQPPARPVAHFDLPRTAVGGVAVGGGGHAFSGGHVVPVAGAVVSRFGEGQKPPFDRGLTIEVEDRRLVRAPRDGRVVFADTYEGFGLLLIIDHGNEYHSLLSGLSRFVVHEGWLVRAGQMVGTLEPADQAAGRLYIELRRRGVPVDPLTWFAAGQDKVRS